jgi:hypothetical protein
MKMIAANKPERIKSYLKEAVRHRSLVGIMLDLVSHKVIANINPRDYFQFGFYKPGKSIEEKSRYVSFRGSQYYPYANNPLKYNFIVTNKDIQKAFLEYLNLPTPRQYTLIGECRDIAGKDQLAEFLGSVAVPIVIKPISETQGTGFLALEPNGGAFAAGDAAYTVDDVWAHVHRDPRVFRKGYLVEEMLINHRAIRALYPYSLNTYRIVTIKTDDNQWHNPCGYLRLGRDGSQFDNGQIEIFADYSGKALFAYDITTEQWITKHPDTGHPLVGIPLVGYKEAIDLAFKASEKFYFMGALGWDIAITDSGPTILEVNAGWGSVAPQIAMGKGIITDEIKKGLKKKRPFSRWDRSRLNPYLCQKPILSRIRGRLKQL